MDFRSIRFVSRENAHVVATQESAPTLEMNPEESIGFLLHRPPRWWEQIALFIARRFLRKALAELYEAAEALRLPFVPLEWIGQVIDGRSMIGTIDLDDCIKTQAFNKMQDREVSLRYEIHHVKRRALYALEAIKIKAAAGVDLDDGDFAIARLKIAGTDLYAHHDYDDHIDTIMTDESDMPERHSLRIRS